MNTINCKDCKWWYNDIGCYNSNWTGKMSDPAFPVCDGISYKVIILKELTNEYPNQYETF